jgi:uncharacterized protein YndB with AHSA1/START domain
MNKKISTIVLFAAITLFLQIQIFAQMKQDNMTQLPNKGDSLHSVTIHQEVDFKVSPERLYTALLNTKQFCEFTAQLGGFSTKSAEIDPATGGAFTLFDGHITGRNVELVPNRRIVQAWRAANWPEGVYSIVRFELVPEGTGTRLVFDHTGFPAEWRDHLAAGWKEHYWDPLIKYLQ